MKQTLTLIAILFFSLVNAQNGAKISYKNNTINYENAIIGKDNGIRFFTFKNSGNSPLIIKKVFSSCGCTVVKKPTKAIAPNETGKIEIKYDVSKKRLGPIRKTVTIYTNAENVDGGIVSLKLKGNVIE